MAAAGPGPGTRAGARARTGASPGAGATTGAGAKAGAGTRAGLGASVRASAGAGAKTEAQAFALKEVSDASHALLRRVAPRFSKCAEIGVPHEIQFFNFNSFWNPLLRFSTGCDLYFSIWLDPFCDGCLGVALQEPDEVMSHQGQSEPRCALYFSI